MEERTISCKSVQKKKNNNESRLNEIAFRYTLRNV
jgi:hypothetical protein